MNMTNEELRQSLLMEANGNDVAQERQAFAMQSRTGLERFKFGAKLGNNFAVVAILCTFGHNNCVSI